ncbi:MAG: hydrocarbon-binding protein [Verrucomicrobia bacterium]|nr:hydrocarbon-binding protein [Verrucomicrobiota bacterium]
MSIRPTLGDFSSIICFKALITGVEDTLSPEGAAAVFTQAGRLRGKNLANSLGMAGKSPAYPDLVNILNNAIGAPGTKLCRIDAVRAEGNDIYVDTSETVCSAGEPTGSSRLCTFTLGAIWGALETMYGRPMTASQTASVLTGGAHDTFRFSQL